MADEFPPDGPKRDVKSAELNIRLELEHDRFLLKKLLKTDKS